MSNRLSNRLKPQQARLSLQIWTCETHYVSSGANVTSALDAHEDTSLVAHHNAPFLSRMENFYIDLCHMLFIWVLSDQT
jgi:hypothetical protein